MALDLDLHLTQKELSTTLFLTFLRIVEVVLVLTCFEYVLVVRWKDGLDLAVVNAVTTSAVIVVEMIVEIVVVEKVVIGAVLAPF